MGVWTGAARCASAPAGNGSGMTAPDSREEPDYSQPPADEPDGTGVTGALEAASQDDPQAGDPLAPLTALTEDDSGSS